MARTRAAWPGRPRQAATARWFRPVVERAAPSDFPRLKIDPGIDPHVSEVGDQTHHKAHEGEDEQRAEHDRIVAVEHAFEAEQAEAVEREDGLDQQRAGEECTNERTGKARDYDQHGVAEDMAVEHLPL